MKYIYPVLICLILINNSCLQNTDSILNFTLSFLGLTPEDIAIPINFDKDKSLLIIQSLILPVVRDIMKDPMNSFTFINDKMNWTDKSHLP